MFDSYAYLPTLATLRRLNSFDVFLDLPRVSRVGIGWCALYEHALHNTDTTIDAEALSLLKYATLGGKKALVYLLLVSATCSIRTCIYSLSDLSLQIRCFRESDSARGLYYIVSST